ncbi:hypothetical protein V5799_019493 [Amblyomma americanum]|uniref:Uncharacterized protein n=1 Tax=Amblyomma americanum TaxID=6943 RepID=A0AAQ4EWC5_AMBAM
MPAISLVIESSHYVHIAYKKQKKLEDTAIKDCIHSLEVDKHPRVSDLVAVLNTLIKIVEVRFLRTEITSAVDVGYEAFRIALGVHYTSMLLKILPYLAQTLLYSKNHSKCREVLSHLRHVAEVAEDTVGMALYYGGLAELLVHQCECLFRTVVHDGQFRCDMFFVACSVYVFAQRHLVTFV